MVKEVDRRDFLKEVALAGAGVLLGTSLEPLNPATVPASAGQNLPDMVVVRGPLPEKITRAAIEALGGIGRFISRGDRVLIKPNIGWARIPQQAANTNPEVVATVVEMCYEAGAKVVRVTDNACNDPRHTFRMSGIAETASRKGAEVFFPDPRKYKRVAINGKVLQSWPVYVEALEVDKLINIPVAKHHNLSRLTMALKNWYGLLGGRRDQLHQEVHGTIADLAGFFKPCLTILDAVRILTANGPSGGSLRDVEKADTLVAGVDQVAIDSYGATLFGLEGKDLKYLSLAAEQGFGKLDYQKLNWKEITVAT